MTETRGRKARPEPYRQMGIEIPETLATRLDAYVASVGATKSFIYREALVAYLSKKEKEKQKKK